MRPCVVSLGPQDKASGPLWYSAPPGDLDFHLAPVSTHNQSPAPGPGDGGGGTKPGPSPGWQDGCPPPAAACCPAPPSACPQDNPRLTEDFVAHLETELEQSRLRETETLGALREMQDKVLDMEKVRLGGCRGHPGDGAVRAPLGGDSQALAVRGSPRDLMARPWNQSPSPTSSPIVSTARCVPLKPWRHARSHIHTQQHDSMRGTPALTCHAPGQQHSGRRGPPGQPILPVYDPLRP